MKYFLFPNTDNETNKKAACDVAAHLRALGHELCTDSASAGLFCGQDLQVCDERADAFDCIAAVGGDGTILRASQLAIARDKPLFGVNSGRIGFLAAFDYPAFSDVTQTDLDSLSLSRRVLLEVTLQSRPDDIHFAVNEAVLSKVSYAKTAEIAIRCGDNDLGTLRCDGVIAASPTGSTGYTLSAGGPIVEPSVSAVIVTPICPHALNARSYVLADDQPVRIWPIERVSNEVYLAIDGNPIASIDHTDCVHIRRSARTLQLLTCPRRNFYEILYNEITERR